MSLIDEFLAQTSFAVVGASQDRAKYGFKVYRDLKRRGYEVFPVNPNAQNILGDTCYRSVADLPKTPDVVTIIVEPGKAKKVVEECGKRGIGRVWLQPGAESPSVIELCDKLGIQVVHGACVLLETPSDDSSETATGDA